MRHRMALMVVIGLGLPGLALAQGAAINGPNAAQLHGQNWNMRQDLSSATPADGVPETRTQRLRRQAAEAAARERAQQQGIPRR